MIDLAELRRYYNTTVVAAMEGITNPVDDLAIAALDVEPIQWCLVHRSVLRLHVRTDGFCESKDLFLRTGGDEALLDACDVTTIVPVEVKDYSLL